MNTSTYFSQPEDVIFVYDFVRTQKEVFKINFMLLFSIQCKRMGDHGLSSSFVFYDKKQQH